MFKFSRLLLHSSRDLLSRKSLMNEATSNFKLLRGITTETGTAAAAATLTFGPGTVSSDFTLFKGKAALCSRPVLPSFVKMESGGVRVDRGGKIILTFWPAIGERKYNWEKRQNFGLSATEVGTLISLGSKESCEFFHDPSMKSSNAGQIRKSLSVKAHADGSGYMLNLSVANNVLNTNDRFSVPVSSGEFAVLRTAFAFALPHIMGWDKCVNQPLSLKSPPAPVTSPTASEWDR